MNSRFTRRPHPIVSAPICGIFAIYCVDSVPEYERIVTAMAMVIVFLTVLATIVAVCIEWVESRENRIRSEPRRPQVTDEA